MDREAEGIVEQMHETSASLANKIESLEQKVSGTIQTVTGTVSAVSDTVEQVKEAVQGTVESVKESVETTVETMKEQLNVIEHIRQHPWVGFGGSFAAGLLTGYLTQRLFPSGGGRAFPRGGRPHSRTGVPTTSAMAQTYSPSAARADGGVREPQRPAEEAGRTQAGAEKKEEGRGLFGNLGDTFGSELSKLKGLAIGAALGAIRDVVSQTAPRELAPQLADVINGLTSKLGGEVIQGKLVDLPRREGQASTGRPFSGPRP